MDVILKNEILNKLSHKGIVAYVAASLAGDVETTTAVLAALVRVQTGVMREGLQELAVVSTPALVRPGQKKGKWLCGDGTGNPGVLDKVAWDDNAARYTVFLDDLKGYWVYLNPDLPFPFAAEDGLAVRRWLAGHSNWKREHWRRALWNRAQSVVNKSAPFFTWIPKLAEHAAESLNEYNKPKEGTGKTGAATSVEEANRVAKERIVAAATNRTRDEG